MVKNVPLVVLTGTEKALVEAAGLPEGTRLSPDIETKLENVANSMFEVCDFATAGSYSAWQQCYDDWSWHGIMVAFVRKPIWEEKKLERLDDLLLEQVKKSVVEMPSSKRGRRE